VIIKNSFISYFSRNSFLYLLFILLLSLLLLFGSNDNYLDAYLFNFYLVDDNLRTGTYQNLIISYYGEFLLYSGTSNDYLYLVLNSFILGDSENDF